jgi:PAS domain S-box-containing protein
VINDERVLILMPTAKDGERTKKALSEVGLECVVCPSLPALCLEIDKGAGVALLPEEAILADHQRCLQQVLESQPTWSDFPLVVLAGAGSGGARLRESMNATLIDRPVKFRSLLSVVQAALRLRRHQYTIRDHLAERDRQAEALKAGEERLRRMINVDGVAVLVWALPEGRLIGANEFFLRMFGYSRTEVESGTLTWRDLTPPEYVAVSEEQLEGFAQTGRIGPYEKEYFRKDRSRAWMVFAGASLGDGTVVEYCIDVGDRKRAEEALREADRKKDDFIALLAHELRNPLAPIRNGLQVLRLASGDVDAVAQARAMMERQLSHMVRLIDDLLDVSRISRNKMELRKERVLLADVVASAVETARPAIEAAGHELLISLPPRPVFLEADLTRLAQVFSNLLTNSAKYTEQGGSIRLSAERHEGEILVSVRDNGIGIPESALPHIFDMFSQVDRSRERSTGGLGIGLALVKGIVEMHGGTVTATSAGEGKGSEFSVCLPLTEARPGPANDGASDHVPHGPGRRVLVVDDNRDGAASMAMMLRLLGDDVRIAHDGLEAVDAFESFRPEVILMDIGMPRLNGLEAARRIREHSAGKSCTIIAVTGWGQDGDITLSREAGCNGHLVKPVTLADLEKLLSQSRR